MKALLLRLFGLLILALAALAAASYAPERKLETLVARWAPPPSDFIDLDGQLLHIRDQGPRNDPEPIVLLHGTSASLHTWEGWVAGLAQTRRVITFDLPGFGLTGPAPDGDYSDVAYFHLLEKLLDHLKLERVVLGGNSLGGQIAWEFASFQPARVSALVLVDPGGLAFRSDAVPLGFRIARLPGLRWVAGKLLPRFLIEKSVRNVFGDPARVTPALIDRYFELTQREGNREALSLRFAALQPGRYADRLDRLKQPTLILWGGLDRLIPPANAQQFASRIAGSKLVMFDHLGHVPQEEDPAATLVPVQAFLQQLPRQDK
ncbi:MAG TPA: alpha/beta fold hydrolase [Burkholderiaceae bacterium]